MLAEEDKNAEEKSPLDGKWPPYCSLHGVSSDTCFPRTLLCVRCLYICHGSTGAIESEWPGYVFVGSYAGQCCF